MTKKEKILLAVWLVATIVLIAMTFAFFDLVGAAGELPTPFPPLTQKYYLPLVLVEYPWNNGWVTGQVESYNGDPYTGCFGLAKVWCDEQSDPVYNKDGCVFVWDDAWSPRQKLNSDGSFYLSTEVEYSVPDHRDQPPYDGGTGYFVPLVNEYCSMQYGYYDIFENGNEPMVIRVYPNKVTEIGTLITWLTGGMEGKSVNPAPYIWELTTR